MFEDYFVDSVAERVEEFLDHLFICLVPDSFQYLAALLNDLLDACLAGVACIHDREHFILERVLQVFSLRPDVFCRSRSTDDNSFEIGYSKHDLVEVLTDTFVVVVGDLFADTFEASSRLSTGTALSGYS